VSGLIEVTERVAYWTEQHPDWEPNPDWPEEVGCVLYEGLDSSVLIDPLIRDDFDADAWSWQAAGGAIRCFAGGCVGTRRAGCGTRR
jgi:hypothetical protein